MRIPSNALLAATLVLTWAGMASAQTADEIVDKTLTALGGRAALSKLTSRSSTGTIVVSTPAGELPGTIVVTNEHPNKSRTLITLDLTSVGAGSMVIDQRCDGTSGYALDSMRGDHELSGAQLETMKNNYFPSPLLDYKERGTALEVTGKDKVGDHDVYVLKVTPKSGPSSQIFIDAQSYLPAKAVATIDVPEIGQVEQTTELSDYRPVDDVQVPFKIRGSSSVQTFTISVNKVEHNVKVDEAIFSKPAAK
jgi:hypothetical protein